MTYPHLADPDARRVLADFLRIYRQLATSLWRMANTPGVTAQTRGGCLERAVRAQLRLRQLRRRYRDSPPVVYPSHPSP